MLCSISIRKLESSLGTLHTCFKTDKKDGTVHHKQSHLFSIKYFFNLTLFWYALIIFCSKRGPTTTRNECIRIIYTKPATHHILLKINSGAYNNREILLNYTDRCIVYSPSSL